MNAYVIQLILIFISLVIIFNVIYSIRSSLLETRISNFSLSKKDFDDTTTFEKISHVLWNLVHLISNLLNKSRALMKLSSRFEKYILIKEEDFKSPIDYITVILISLILSIILYLFLVLAKVFSFNIILLAIFIILGVVLPSLYWQIRYEKKCKNISNKLYESMIVLDDNISKTNIYNALSKVVRELDDDIADEYQRILIDLSYNISLSQAFRRFYKRTRIPEIRVIYHLLDIDSDNLEDTFHIVRSNFEYYDKKNTYKDSLNTILNVIKMVFILLPLAIILFMSISDFNYFNNVFNNAYGIIIFEVIVFIYIVFIHTIRKMMEARK